MLAEEVMYEIGNKAVGYLTADAVRSILKEKGFWGLTRKLTARKMAEMLEEQFDAFGWPPGYEDWEYTVEEAAARALVEEAGLSWPEKEENS